MKTEHLRMHERPKLHAARLVMGFSGWMDGGDVSTGTIDYLVEKLEAAKLADIDPAPFYIYNFPGTMDVAALFRPHTRIENGLVTQCEEPASTFYCDPSRNLILFKGKEPNLRWHEFAECIFAIVSEFDVSRACFVGSVAGLVPHTRDPRIFSSISDADLLPLAHRHGLLPSNYEGPGSFVTYLTSLAKPRGLDLFTLVSEIPAYVQGKNVKCIAAVVRKLTAILDLEIDLTDLKAWAKEFERRLNDTIRDRPELAEQIRKIEKDYDAEIFDATVDDDLKEWLQSQGIRLD